MNEKTLAELGISSKYLRPGDEIYCRRRTENLTFAGPAKVIDVGPLVMVQSIGLKDSSNSWWSDGTSGLNLTEDEIYPTVDLLPKLISRMKEEMGLGEKANRTGPQEVTKWAGT